MYPLTRLSFVSFSCFLICLFGCLIWVFVWKTREDFINTLFSYLVIYPNLTKTELEDLLPVYYILQLWVPIYTIRWRLRHCENTDSYLSDSHKLPWLSTTLICFNSQIKQACEATGEAAHHQSKYQNIGVINEGMTNLLYDVMYTFCFAPFLFALHSLFQSKNRACGN